MTMVPDTKKSNFGNQKLLRFHIWFNMTLHYKMRQKLLQNVTASFITKYGKTFITKCVRLFIT